MSVPPRHHRSTDANLGPDHRYHALEYPPSHEDEDDRISPPDERRRRGGRDEMRILNPPCCARCRACVCSKRFFAGFSLAALLFAAGITFWALAVPLLTKKKGFQEKDPDIPSGLQSANVAADSFTVSWDVQEGFNFDLQVSNTTQNASWATVATRLIPAQYTLHHLTGNRTYGVRTRASSTLNTKHSKWSLPVWVNTLEPTVPNPPNQFEMLGGDNGTVSLGLFLPDSDGGSPLTSLAFVEDDPSGNFSEQTTFCEMKIQQPVDWNSALNCSGTIKLGTTLMLRAVARNAEGASSFSSQTVECAWADAPDPPICGFAPGSFGTPNLTSYSTTPQSLTFSWEITGTVSHFEVARDNWWNQTGLQTVATVPVAAVNSYTFPRPQLPPGSPVQIAIRGVGSSGAKGDWETVTVSTKSVEKCGDQVNMLQYRKHRADYNDITTSIMVKCYFSTHRADCMNEAIENQLGFTKDCAPCHGTMIQCALTNCLTSCMSGKTSPSCMKCVNAHCLSALADCMGFEGYGPDGR